jgi:hypothetical protein
MQRQYPFCRLSGPANVLIMPAFHSASISTKMLQELGGSTVIGPLLVGLEQAGADRAAQRQGQRHRQHGGDRRLFEPLVLPEGCIAKLSAFARRSGGVLLRRVRRRRSIP